MASKTSGTALLIIGILGILIGVFLILLYKGQDFECLHTSIYSEEQCMIARVLYNVGVVAVIIGIIFAVVGGIVIAIRGREQTTGSEFADSYQYTCPRCQWKISYYTSPQNCANCGLPIDWSMAQAPQK
ncbi:MAG: hypothetical protein KAW09_09530 [Thermoplasmata archaeon]|nr:hypothetical protein [Thermoplasmata archaeon]